MVVTTCKECKESIYLTPHAFWNRTDFGANCDKWNTINTTTLENGELKTGVVTLEQLEFNLSWLAVQVLRFPPSFLLVQSFV